jgi:hypothetical protein
LLSGDAVGSRDKAEAIFCPFTYSNVKTIREDDASFNVLYAVPDEFANIPKFDR